eukprot:TRINITY_DN5903_c0_g2_i1.p1 TRINITY_DN5903_c0_g2~~TRINITY_DN5903_c0_g2_i1.p1  ORF type:complete len:182 (-),score=18.88 TRINITY_DN5903_c0_g2_i1:108-653(-)
MYLHSWQGNDPSSQQAKVQSFLKVGFEYSTEEEYFEDDRKGQLILMSNESKALGETFAAFYQALYHYFVLVQDGRVFVVVLLIEGYTFFSVPYTDERVTDILHGNICMEFNKEVSAKELLTCAKQCESESGKFDVAVNNANHFVGNVGRKLNLEKFSVSHRCECCPAPADPFLGLFFYKTY